MRTPITTTCTPKKSEDGWDTGCSEHNDPWCPWPCVVAEHTPTETEVETADNALTAARSQYGDEGEGYDTHVLAATLIAQGWTYNGPDSENDR